MTELPWLALLHDWSVYGEYDGGYDLVRCRICLDEGLAPFDAILPSSSVADPSRPRCDSAAL